MRQLDECGVEQRRTRLNVEFGGAQSPIAKEYISYTWTQGHLLEKIDPHKCPRSTQRPPLQAFAALMMSAA